MDGKTTAIVSHITLIGWIIAFVTNNSKKDPLASFYIRQMLGIFVYGLAVVIACMILAFIPFIGWIAGLVLYFSIPVFWIISLINAFSGKMQELPIIGKYFQEWFKSVA